MKASAVTRSQYLLLLAQVGRLALSLAITGFLGRALAPGDFGFFALMSVLFLVSQEILDMGSTAAATRHIAQRPGNEPAVLTALLSWRRLVAVLLALACMGLAAAGFVSTDGQRGVLVAAAIGLFLLHYTAYYVVFQVRQAFGCTLLLGLAGQLAFLLASIASISYQLSGAVIGLLVALREIIQVLGSRLIAMRMLGYRIRAGLFDAGIRPLIRVAWVFGLAALLYKLAFYAGSFFLWTLSTPEALGSFSASQRIFSPLLDTTWIFVTPLIAAMSHSALVNESAFRRQFNGYFRILLGAAAILVACGLYLAPVILGLLYGERYGDGPWSSVVAFRWLTLGFSCTLVIPILVVAALARHRERELLWVSTMGLVLNIAINAWTVPRLGAEGAAMATCYTEGFILLALTLAMAARGELRLDVRILVYLIPAIVLGILLYGLDGQPLARLAVAFIVAPMSLLLLWQLPEQKACRASLAVEGCGAEREIPPLQSASSGSS